MRPVDIIPNFYSNADGSCLIKFGNTHVICAATIEEKVPQFLKRTQTGWVTAEYGMLPCSANDRIEREAYKGKQTGRTVEIQRLIGRTLRSVVNLADLGERQIIIDCDVIKSDGGTRTASITGGYVAMALACEKLLKREIININPIKSHVIAVSCGVVNGVPVLDLDYSEDSKAEVDANFILSNKDIIEIQACGEQHPFTEEHFKILLEYAKSVRDALIQKQIKALNGGNN